MLSRKRQWKYEGKRKPKKAKERESARERGV
jgi:hypothetical protein